MNLLVGIPSGGNASKPFLESLAALELPHDISGFDHVTVRGNYVPAQRELLARRAFARNADAVFMVDDDMVLPPHTLKALADVLRSSEKIGMVGALYYSRDGIRPMAVNEWNSKDTTQAWIPAFGSAVIDVDGVGLGCALIRTDAMRALVPPVFASQIYIEEAAAQVRICNEDFLLCERLRAAGYSVKLHPGVRCGHYDRASGRIMPLSWEPESVTNAPRMMVVEPGPLYSLRPYEVGASTVRETHQHASIEYIFVD